MEMKRLTRDDDDFYLHLGPVFGSRLIEKQTKDRFYDDAGKVWFLIPGRGAASLQGNTIRNFWAANDEAAGALIDALQQEQQRLDGILPRTHEELFRRLGFETRAYRTNFIEVSWYEKD